MGQRNGLKWGYIEAGLDYKQINRKLQSIFQLVLDAGTLQERDCGIAFNQKIDIASPGKIIKP